MHVELLAMTRLLKPTPYPERAALALTAIRTCYSPNAPSRILEDEGPNYFGKPASDGDGGTDAHRLIRFIQRSGHTSTLEHISYTFAIEDVSRSLLAQLTRHRVGFSFSVQSQRYVRFGSDDKSGGFDYVVPPSVAGCLASETDYRDIMGTLQSVYDDLRSMGIPPEDARMVLPNSATCHLVMSCNLTALIGFYGKRRRDKGAQWEIVELADRLRAEVVAVDPWADELFD